MSGIIFAIIAGAAMSIQGVFNTRVSEKIGLYESNTLVALISLIVSVIVMAFLRKGDFSALGAVNKLYLTGGVIGVIITITVMLAIGKTSPTVATSVILIAQLAVAALIDMLGLFGAEKVSFHITKLLGLALMIGGIVLFKLKG